jgi:hypothetical protein
MVSFYLISCPKSNQKFLTRIISSNKIRRLFQNNERRHENDNDQHIPKCQFERASRSWILGTIEFVAFDHSTAGVAQPAVFDSDHYRSSQGTAP